MIFVAASDTAHRSMWQNFEDHQTFVLVAVLVGAHLLLIAAVLACLWKQTPNSARMNRVFLEEQREEFKRTIQKKD